MDRCIVKATSPVALHSLISSIDEGSTLAADSYGLTNNTALGIWLKRFVFVIEAAGGSDNFLGAALSARMRIGQFDITNGFVPLLGLGGRKSSGLGFGRPSTYWVGGSGLTNGYVLELGSPVYLPSGMGISLAVARDSAGSAGSCAVSFGAVGYFTEERPKSAMMPYISAFSNTRSSSSNTAAISDNTQLQNVFRVPMTVEKFIGGGDRGASGGQPMTLGITEFTSEGNLVELYYRGSSRLTAAPIPFHALFKLYYGGELAAGMVIDPGDWFNVRYSNIVANTRLVTSMIAYREERL